ncbi:hypothetical protein QF037_010041 [Streptomyces canus]|nr:hypothetical protein [Streptomyces canus]
MQTDGDQARPLQQRRRPFGTHAAPASFLLPLLVSFVRAGACAVLVLEVAQCGEHVVVLGDRDPQPALLLRAVEAALQRGQQAPVVAGVRLPGGQGPLRARLLQQGETVGANGARHRQAAVGARLFLEGEQSAVEHGLQGDGGLRRPQWRHLLGGGEGDAPLEQGESGQQRPLRRAQAAAAPLGDREGGALPLRYVEGPGR